LVEPGLDQLVAPCSACYLNLKKTDKLMQTEPAWRERISAALTAGGLSYQPGRVKVRHLLDVFINDVGAETIKTHVVQPLKGLRVAPYYGCQIVRPMNGDNPEYPTQLDELLAWLGAEVIDYPLKTHCCGGHMTQISEALAFELIRRLLYTTAEYEADLIACLCPMCQLNLDAYQGRVNNFFNTTFNIPILFFTQLVGLAFGLRPTSLGFGKEIVPAEPVLLAKLGVETEEGEAPGHKPTPKGGLPMPRME
jgi:heterodisulfide reductase subunit B